MTIQELAQDTRSVVFAADISEILHLSPQSIREAARTPQGRKELGFPVIVCGNQVRIPRISFLQYLQTNPREKTEKGDQ